MSPIDQSTGLRDALVADLSCGRWKAGDRLPTERQFCATYRIGRATVRRALAEIKAMGLITQTVGSGTYVTQEAAAQLQPVPSFSPAMLMEARLALEPGLVDLVVRNATAADFATLDSCCDRANTAASLAEFERWDSEFHVSLARASHNAFLVLIHSQIARARETAEWGLLKRRSATAERRAQYGRDHRAILDALMDRDAASARTALRTHLQDVQRTMFENARAETS